MEQVLFAEPMIAQIVAVVGCEHDHGVLHPAGSFQILEQYAKLIVELLDQAHVCRDHALAHVVAREGSTDPMVLPGPVHRMIGHAFGVRAHCW